MPILQIDSKSLSRTDSLIMANISAQSYQTSSGVKIDGLLDKTLTFPGLLKVAAGTNRWWPATGISVSELRVNLITGPTGSQVRLQVNKNGSEAGNVQVQSGTTVATTSVDIEFAVGDYVTVDVTQVGSSYPGSDAVLTFIYSRT